MAYTTINKSTDYFNTKLYTGNGSTQSITGVGFQPDWTWTKSRTNGEHHSLYDVVRGVTKPLFTNLSYGEGSANDTLTSFDTDGFSIGNNAYINENSQNYVSWNWLADNTSGSSNTDGSITSTVSANTTSGFSIVTYTGTGSATTVGHGLGIAPAFIIVKCFNTGSTNWQVYSKALDADKFLEFNSTTAELSQGTYNMFNSTRPTSTVFSIGTHNNTNGSGNSYVAYCFAEKTGYSKFGSYIGNGTNDGTFVYTGFKPVFLLIKNKGTTENWNIWDNKRDTYNAVESRLYPNTTGTESTSDSNDFDFLSNGFKVRNNGGNQGASGNTYIYMAFGQSLVGSNNIPCTAR
tara:strand:- start:304 stop:1347 length:1044 start_codon:yes stop_codon:yes gene_type:complete